MSVETRCADEATPSFLIRSYEVDAATFGEFMRHGGSWSYGLIVARWVQPGAGHGGDRRSGQVSEVTLEKVSPARFAEDAQVSRNTVSKYLRAWDAAAEAGVVPISSSIEPGEHIDLQDALPDWGEFYRKANTKTEDADEQDVERKDRSSPPLPSVAKNKFFKTFGGLSKIMQYDAETVVKLLGDDQADYLHLEQQVMILAHWLNEINERRAAAEDKESQ